MGKQKGAPGLLELMIDTNVNQDPKDRLLRIAEMLNDLQNIREGEDSESMTDVTIDTLVEGDRQRVRIIHREGEILYLESERYFEGFISIYANSGRRFPRPD